MRLTEKYSKNVFTFFINPCKLMLVIIKGVETMDQYLTTDELAEKLKVTRQAIWIWRKKGLPFVKLGRSVRFKPDEVDAWIRKQNIEGVGNV